MSAKVANHISGEFENCFYCGTAMIQKELKLHIERCDLRLVPCEQCGVKITKAYMAVHIKEHCSKRVTKCEHCQYDFVADTLEKHNQVCDLVPKVCVNKCGKSIAKKDFHRHVAEDCLQAVVQCDMCKVNIAKAYREHHMKDLCLKRTVRCEYCKCDLVADMLLDHSETCELVPLFCQNMCGREMPRKDLEQHMERDCPKKWVKCEFCRVEVTKVYLAHHIKENCKKRNTSCEYCNFQLIAEGLSDHYEECECLPVVCQYNCGRKIPRNKLWDHMVEKCPKTVLKCDECDEEVTREDLDRHTQDLCEKRIISCKYCSAELAANTLSDHHEECDMFPVICENKCGRKVPKTSMQEHLNTKCPKTLLKCDQCDVEILRMYKSYHLKEQCNKRMIKCEYCKSRVSAGLLMEHFQECDLVPMECPNICGEEVPKKDLDHHLADICPKRMVQCEYCDNEIEAQLVSKHHSRCVKYPVPCTLGCGVNVVRDDMERHMDEECARMNTQCPYKRMRCDYEDSPSGVREHVQKETVHTELMKGVLENLLDVIENQRNRIAELERQNNSFIWKITGITEKLTAMKPGTKISSEEFYSSKYGYKFRVDLYPNGVTGCKGFLSVSIRLVAGEYDSILEWPFARKVTYKIIDQSKRHKDIVDTFEGFDDECFQRPEKAKRNVGYGECEFVTHRKLRNGSYICDDTLFFEVTVH